MSTEPADKPVFRRVLLKMSGEMLAGDQDMGIEPAAIKRFAADIHDVQTLGVEVCVVIGGGNIFRGLAGASRGMDRAHADYMGMLATVINGLALQDALEQRGCYTRVLSAIAMDELCEKYIRRRAVRHMEKGRVVIFAAGTGNPYFSTDTAAALRAAEIHADVILKATKVDGIYDSDPVQNADATRFDDLTYLEALNRGLKVMDATAISLCMDNDIPIIVYDYNRPGNTRRVVCGERLGTLLQGRAGEIRLRSQMITET